MTRLFGLIRQLDSKERAKLMRGTMRSCANKLKAQAFKNLADAVHIRDRRAMRKTIWTKVYKRVAGFRVTTAGNKHLYPSRMKNKQGATRDVPLARWLENGTFTRSTRKGGHNRGFLPAVGFLRKASDSMAPGMVSTIEGELIKKLQKKAKEYE